VAVYLALAVGLNWHVWSASPTSQTQVGGDQFGTIWFLRWVPFALSHGHNPFFSDWVNYPFGVNLLTNTSVPLLGLVGAPITWAWGAIATYNVWSTLALVASATTGYLLAHRLVAWRPAAFASGLLYGFSPYMIGQSGHLNLVFVALPPLIYLCGYELICGRRDGARRDPRRWGVLLGVLIVAQFFMSSEVLVSTLVIGFVAVATAALAGHRSTRAPGRDTLLGAGWAAGTLVVVLGYPAWFTLRGPGSIRGPIQVAPQAYRADLLGPVVPTIHQWIAPVSLAQRASEFANSTTENGSYLGIILVMVLVAGVLLLWRSSTVVKVAAVAAVAAFVLSLGAALVIDGRPSVAATGIPLPEGLFVHIPLLSNTVPSRYALYTTLFGSLILAAVLERLHRGRRWISSYGVPAVVAVLALLPLIPAVPINVVGPVGTPAYFTSPHVRQIPVDSVALVFPYPTVILPSGVLWQVAAGLRFKMPGGYFLVPGRHGTIADNPALPYVRSTLTARVFSQMFTSGPPREAPALRSALRAQWGSWQVRTLVASMVGVPDAQGVEQFLTWASGVAPVLQAKVLVWTSASGSL